eukprot:5702183-Pleurochrysis_carterae.AAC.1
MLHSWASRPSPDAAQAANWIISLQQTSLQPGCVGGTTTLEVSSAAVDKASTAVPSAEETACAA